MECPRCGNTNLSVKDTRSVADLKIRIRRCETSDDSRGCGLTFRTCEEIIEVEVFNHKPDVLAAEYVDVNEYNRNHRDKELQGGSGFQNEMFKK